MRGRFEAGPCYLYALIDPADGSFFYIGVSIDIQKRLQNHKNDPCSSAYPRCREIIAAGGAIGLTAIGKFENRRQAEIVETEWIERTPWLVNIRARR